MCVHCTCEAVFLFVKNKPHTALPFAFYWNFNKICNKILSAKAEQNTYTPPTPLSCDQNYRIFSTLNVWIFITNLLIIS